MSLYGKLESSDAPEQVNYDSMAVIFKWLFLYLGVASLIHWGLGAWNISRVWSYFATRNLTTIWQLRLALGLSSSLIFFGLMLWARRGRSVFALSVLILYSVVGLACVIFAAIAQPARMPDEPDVIKRALFWISAAFRSRGMVIGWVVSLAQLSGIKLTLTVITIIDSVQHVLLIGIYILALMKQPNVKAA